MSRAHQRDEKEPSAARCPNAHWRIVDQPVLGSHGVPLRWNLVLRHGTFVHLAC
jgi:hypothetical protein